MYKLVANNKQICNLMRIKITNWMYLEKINKVSAKREITNTTEKGGKQIWLQQIQNVLHEDLQKN